MDDAPTTSPDVSQLPQIDTHAAQVMHIVDACAPRWHAARQQVHIEIICYGVIAYSRALLWYTSKQMFGFA
jgi:hypothetical protein